MKSKSLIELLMRCGVLKKLTSLCSVLLWNKDPSHLLVEALLQCPSSLAPNPRRRHDLDIWCHFDHYLLIEVIIWLRHSQECTRFLSQQWLLEILLILQLFELIFELPVSMADT